ncbi:MAG: hypothetical protein ACKOEX_11450 [Planctomycetia bacterium]
MRAARGTVGRVPFMQSPGWLCIVVVLPCMFGCGTNGRASVTGTVTLAGKAVEAGTIAFRPLDGKAPTAGGFITKGSFSVEVPLGRMRVEINASEKTGEVISTAQGSPVEVDVMGEAIPERYNSASTLMVDVKSGVNRVDFKLDR